MYFIKPCPSCGTKLRFPIDKGTIRVRCSCGTSFVADPDDPILFQDGKFDLGGPGPNKKEGRKIPGFPGLKSILINSLYSAKYRIQNFRLLPSAEQRKILIILALACALAGLIAYLVYNYLANRPVIV